MGVPRPSFGDFALLCDKVLLMWIIRAVVGIIAAFQIVYWSSTIPFYPRVGEFSAVGLINCLFIGAGLCAFSFAVRPTPFGSLPGVVTWSNLAEVPFMVGRWFITLRLSIR